MSRDTVDWRDRAACRRESPELFFPTGTTGPAALQLVRAKQVCAGCAVREDCLQWSLSRDVEQGVWGGLSEEERRSRKRRAARYRLADRQAGSTEQSAAVGR